MYSGPVLINLFSSECMIWFISCTNSHISSNMSTFSSSSFTRNFRSHFLRDRIHYDAYIYIYIYICVCVCVYMNTSCINYHTTVTIVPYITRILNIVQYYCHIFSTEYHLILPISFIAECFFANKTTFWRQLNNSKEYGYMYLMDPWTYVSLIQIRPPFIQRLLGWYSFM